MKTWKKWVLIALTVLVAIILTMVLLKFSFVNFLVDWWWFQSQHMTLYFFLRIVHRYLVFVFFTIVFFAIFFFNFWIASRFIGFADRESNRDKRDLVKRLHESMQRMYLPVSVIMALPVAVPMFLNWEKALLFLFGAPSGMTDPLFGKDISFYFFSLPVYHLIQKEILLVSVVLFLGIVFLYWYEHRLLTAKDQALPRGARIHISILGAVIVGILCWGFLLERYDLLYETANQPVFYGPGYVEMRVILPFIWLSVLFLATTGIALIYSANRRRGWKVVAIFGLLFLLSVTAKNADFFADQIRTYIVAPNQIIRERDYIAANVRSTLAAFGLDDVTTLDFKPRDKNAFKADDPDLIRRLQNIPVWDREMLGNVFEEIQGIRTYYGFSTIDVDRYTVEGSYRQVYLGPREIELGKLPASAQNWINTHLQYTHGRGVAMIPAAQAGDEFMTWFIKDVPPKSDYGLTIKRSSIYYGLGDKPYVLAPNDAGEIGYPLDDGEAMVNYTGTGGVPIHSLLRKLVLADYFKDRNIFFTTKTNRQSRILFRRNIVEQIRHLTPFLKLDADPYIVTTDEGLFWIQDAYTTADNYPMVAPLEDGFNYIRNSVKIVTDAYNGTATYYVADTRDPIIKAYQRMYPGVFKPLDQMPAELCKHIRYPNDIFHTQVAVYAKYHQEDPERFYRQEDIWEFSKMPQGRRLVPANPYYLTLDLIKSGEEDFLLFMPLSPFGRDNLRALMIAGSDGDNYGKIFVYRFPQDKHVYGPAQINSVINQDIVISAQFTLWNQEGSQVILGKMIIEPMGGSLLYIQPVYLQEDGPLKIPQLKRLIMALDDAVVMAPSLEEAAVKLETELIRKSSRRPQIDQRQPVPQAPEETPATKTPATGADSAETPAKPPQSPATERPQTDSSAAPQNGVPPKKD
ncbi:UPF0182 family protein [Desulfosarcina ovata]|uniref:UPF0182 protein DSCOOX_33550 n=1 Tax=Desulfosarcina ovata subsp. ovata TaxID=2752305 RepID=A0A5K8AC28_9BACT|nr:UPF0182 family protein [Desulfosarcina ovata]BBO90175.1 UPF0182 protein [Desulfosarcina ovata subsp. ovata]